MACADQFFRTQLFFYSVQWQKRNAMAFQRHGFQAFGHVGLVNPIEVNRRGRLLQHQVDHAPKVSARCISQIRQRLPRASGQGKLRLARSGCPHERRQQFSAQRHHFITIGIKLKRL